MSTCGGGGIRCEGSTNCTFTNNLLIANTALHKGAGFLSMDSTSAPILINNTITRNRCISESGYDYGGGLMTNYGGSAIGKNNIVYDNYAFSDPNISGTVAFTYSCVQGGLPGTGNIDTNPMFVHNPPAGYCFLSQITAGQNRNSPCADAGDPASAMITGSTRTDLAQDIAVVDMGFHWWLRTDVTDWLDLVLLNETELPELVQKRQILLSSDLCIGIQPNPFNPTTVLSYQLQVASWVNLSVYDVTGRQMAELVKGMRNAGIHEVTFDASNLASGVYIYQLEAGDFKASGKMVFMK